MQAATAAGYSTSEDLHGEREEGFARGEVTIDPRGRRASSSRAYLHPIADRQNLTVTTRALVHRILIEKGRAVGVEYERAGRLHRVRAEREVILCAGSYNSPQLLLLSGVGPAQELERHGIRPVLDLPGVGQNLSEHARVPVEFEASAPVTFLNELRLDRVIGSVLRWGLFGTGPFATQLNSCNIVIRTSKGLEQPDVQLMCNPVRMDARIWFPGISKRQEHRITADAVVLHPASRGHVTLKSADPHHPPRIVLNLFAEAADIDTAIRGVAAARAIYRTPPQALITGRELRPGPGVNTREEFVSYIRANGGVTQHPVGTCAMGVGREAVVDERLRVRGIDGLRVADASIMPTVPGGNTNAATIMVGEKASDLILG
jgi:choline dehydrogenase